MALCPIAAKLEEWKARAETAEAEAGSAYRAGADYALYELCKELDVRSSDIRKSGDTIDGMAARLADRIREVLCSADPV